MAQSTKPKRGMRPAGQRYLRTADLLRSGGECCALDEQHRVCFHARQGHLVAAPVTECSASSSSASGSFQSVVSTEQPIAAVVVLDDDNHTVASQEAQFIADGNLQLVDGEGNLRSVEQGSVLY